MDVLTTLWLVLLVIILMFGFMVFGLGGNRPQRRTAREFSGHTWVVESAGIEQSNIVVLASKTTGRLTGLQQLVFSVNHPDQRELLRLKKGDLVRFEYVHEAVDPMLTGIYSGFMRLSK